MLGDHRCRNKALFYEGALNVPLCIRPPGGVDGWRSEAIVDHLDVVETMLELADADTLAGSEYRSSLVSKILDDARSAHAHLGKEAVFSEVRLFSMVRNNRFKLSVDSLMREPLELYDMTEDPLELRNLVEDQAYRTIREELISDKLDGLLNRLDRNKLAIYEATLKADPHRGGWQSIDQAT